MAELTVQNITQSGITPTFSSASGSGDVMSNDGASFIYVKNGSGESLSVTITAQTTTVNIEAFGQLPASNTVMSISSGSEGIIGPFPTFIFNNSNSQIEISYNVTESVTIGGFRLSN